MKIAIFITLMMVIHNAQALELSAGLALSDSSLYEGSDDSLIGRIKLAKEYRTVDNSAIELYVEHNSLYGKIDKRPKGLNMIGINAVFKFN